MPQQTHAVALESLAAPRLAFPALHVPKPVRASAHVALPSAPAHFAPRTARPATTPHHRVQRAAVATQRVRVPVVSNRYELVPQPKPAVKQDTSAPVYEESIGTMPDAMTDPTTPDPVAQAAAQAADQERIARLEAEAQARAQAEAAAAQARAQAEAEAAAAAAAATTAVTVTVTPPAAATTTTTTSAPETTTDATTQPDTAATTDGAPAISAGPETISAAAPATVASPPATTIESAAGAPAEPVAAPSPTTTVTQVSDPQPELVSAPATDPLPLPPVDTSSGAIPIDPVVAAAPPATPTTSVGSTGGNVAAVPATGAGTETATAAGGGTSATGSASTTTSGDTVIAPANETPITTPDPATLPGETVAPANARGPPEDATAISAANGGVAASGDGGATVTFAPGVLVSDVYVTVTPSTVSAPADVSAASPAYDLVAYDASGNVVERFGGAAELTIGYSSATPPVIYYLDPSDGPIALDSWVDPETHTVHARLVHFSTYVAATPLEDFANQPPVTSATIDVTVLAPGGSPLAGALVEGTSDTGYTVRGRTGATGAVSLGVSRGAWTISIGAMSNLQSGPAQNVDTTTGSGSYALAFNLTQFAVYVTGTTRDSAGNPLAGVRVDAASQNGAARADDFAISGADGSYRLGGLLGDWSIRAADLTDYYPASLEGTYTPGASHRANLVVAGATTQDLTFTLMPRVLTGSLKDQNGNGVPGATIALEVYSQIFDFHFRTTVVSAADGSYTARVPWDVHRVDVLPASQPAGYADLDRAASTWNAPSPQAGGAIAIADFHYYKFSTSVSGVVRGESGPAIAGFIVAAEFYSALRARWFWIEATTDANGAWMIAGDPGDWNVHPRTSVVGYSAASVTGIVVGAGGATGVEVVLIGGASVSGTVTLQNTGAAVAGVGVNVCGFTCAVTNTNSLGEYSAWLAVDPQTRSSNATVRMLTAKTGFARSTATVTGATAGAAFVRNLSYVPFSTPYSGTVLDSFGTPVAGAVVRLSDGLDEALTTSQADGTWAGLGPDVEARVSATGVFPTSGNSAVLIASAAATGVVLLLPATRLAGTVTDDLGTALAGVRIDAERWLCSYGAANCSWADLFGSFYGQKLSTVASTVTDAGGTYAFTLDPALFSDNFPLRLAPQRLAGHLTPGLSTPTYLPGRVTAADFTYARATVEIQGVANGGVYGQAVTPVIVTTPAIDAVEVTLNGASWTPGALSADGAYTIVARALRSGAEVARAAVTFAIDTIAPLLTVGGVADGGAYPTAVTPGVVASDANLAFTTITLDGSPFAGGAVSDEGRHVLVVSARDWASNASTATIVFWVDLTAPTTTLTSVPAVRPFDAASVFTLTAADEGSGVQATYWLLDGGSATLYSAPFSLGALSGPHTLNWYSVDRAGNTELQQSAALSFSRPAVSVADVSVSEGNTGTTSATFVFTLSESPPADVTIAYALAGDTATAGVDFVGGTGTVTIAAGTTSASVAVTINGDTLFEPDENFTLTITGVSGAEVADGVATGTIVNDDGPQADLVLSKTVAPSTVVIGAQVLYRVDVRNDGPQSAQNVEFVDHIDATADFVAIDAAVTSFGACSWVAASRTLSCSSASLAPGATASAGFTFRTTGLGTFTNTATVTSTTSDPNAANNTDSAVLEIVPAATSRPDLLAADDSGLSSADNLTFVTRPRFSVTTAPRVVVELVEAGTVLGSAVANDLGVAIVQVDVAHTLADGLHAIAARARVNALSTPGPVSTALNVRIDTVAPSAPVLALRAGEDSGLSNTDNVTNVGQWHIYASVGDAVQIPTTEIAPNGRVIVYAAVATFVFFPDAGGGLGPDGLQGTWTYQARGIDLAGNVSELSNVLAITYDSIAPAAPSRPDLRAADDSGVSNTDDVTNVARPGFDTTFESGATPALFVDGAAYSGAVLADGVHSVSADVTDVAGNVSARSEALTVTIDTVAPGAPTRPDLRAADDSGVFGDDDVTNVNRPRFDTTSESGATSALFVDGVAYSGEALADGAHVIIAKASDLAGNVSTVSEQLTVTIDTTAPAGGLELNAGAAGTRDPNVRGTTSFTDVQGPYQLRFSLDGGATWSDWQAYTTELLVGLPGADGIKTVLVEVRDRAGNVGSARDDIRLDRTGPALTVTSPAPGTSLDVSQIVSLIFTAADPSGIASTTITLDGRPFSGSSIDAWLLGPRSHTLVITVVDTLGNASTVTVTFEVHASIAGLSQAIRRALAAGLIDPAEAQTLLSELDRAAAYVAKGDLTSAAKKLSSIGLELFREAGRKIDYAFGNRAAAWALELAERLSPGSTTAVVAKINRRIAKDKNKDKDRDEGRRELVRRPGV